MNIHDFDTYLWTEGDSIERVYPSYRSTWAETQSFYDEWMKALNASSKPLVDFKWFQKMFFAEEPPKEDDRILDTSDII